MCRRSKHTKPILFNVTYYGFWSLNCCFLKQLLLFILSGLFGSSNRNFQGRQLFRGNLKKSRKTRKLSAENRGSAKSSPPWIYIKSQKQSTSVNTNVVRAYVRGTAHRAIALAMGAGCRRAQKKEKRSYYVAPGDDGRPRQWVRV